ncbi:MAG: FkbM family methyltransferase [Lachnospiraceae bacterium]|nr:FkbM family methyltransferase [Lachnospiraceae bacterium]
MSKEIALNDVTKKILSWMADEQSKEIYLNRVLFEETLDYSYIQKTIDKYIPKYSDQKWFFVSEALEREMQAYDRIIVAGAGGKGRILIKALQNRGMTVELCIDNFAKGDICGVEICSPKNVNYENACVIISLSEKKPSEIIKKQLVELGVPVDSIIMLIDFVSPAIEAHEIEYFDDDTIITYKEKEVFVDCGVLDFESSKNFYNCCCEHGVKDISIIAFEPDYHNYEISKAEAEKLRNKGVRVTLFQNGVWSENKELGFASGNGGSSKIVSESEDTVSVVAMDSVVDEQVTYIKMDIEGAELEALKGAKRIIKEYRPKLAICIYHKPEDIVEIPLYIKELVPDYNLYVRHYSNGIGELVLYAV